MDRDDPSVMPRLRITPAEARLAPRQDGHLSALIATCGSVELRWFRPGDPDTQTPHDRDEIYMVVTGTAVFMRAERRAPFSDDHELDLPGEERVAVQPGDVLFVPAGTTHQFEAASADFGCWMLFYGPEGGEA